jgi:protein gp37
MHDIWNPWHGCRKIIEGCQHCYMYFLDAQRDQDGSRIYKTANFDYPLQRDRRGAFKIKSGEHIRVCLTSDFFLEEADQWRDAAWRIIGERPDVVFYLLTKRPQRVRDHLPKDWGDGWENVFFGVTAENQRRADERVPILLELPFRHKGVTVAPFIGEVSLAPYLASGQIEEVLSGGENYDGARPCHYEWVKGLSDQCRRHDTQFNFIETGTVFVRDARTYRIPDKRVQSRQAFLSGLSVTGRPVHYALRHPEGTLFDEPVVRATGRFRDTCETCGSRMTCNGCSGCGACDGEAEASP